MDTISSTQENALIINKIHAPVTIPEIKKYILVHINDWIESPVIWDLHELDFTSVSNDEIRTFVQSMAERSKIRQNKKTAIVAREDLQFGLMRILKSYAEIDKFRFGLAIFRDIPSAKEWILAE